MSAPIYLLFDERMTKHAPINMPETIPDRCMLYRDEEMIKKGDDVIFERPARLYALYCGLNELQERIGGERFIYLPCHAASKEIICLTHSERHYNTMEHTAYMTDEQLKGMEVDNDLYFNRHTFAAATLACGGVIDCVNAVTETSIHRAIALVRPPGHHALRNNAMGFCYFNNIAVAAKYAIHSGRAKRVFILDWDIHHGNGIQDLTYDDPNIFYLSIHRGPSKTSHFYPGTGIAKETGCDRGIGSNLNIVWDEDSMGNTEYAGSFKEIVLPAMAAFNPDLVIVACGFDAAKGDLLGDCLLSPEMYYYMTESLLETLGDDIPLVIALEGGYNLRVINDCMQSVALALLDEPLHTDGVVDGLEELWSRAKLNQSSTSSRKESAIKSIKNSARALARSQVPRKPTAPIQTPREHHFLLQKMTSPNPCGTLPTIVYPVPQPIHPISCRPRMLDSDRYPIKKRALLRKDLDHL